MFVKGAKVTFTYDSNTLNGNIIHVLAAGETPSEYFASLEQSDLALTADRCFIETTPANLCKSYLVKTKKTKNVDSKLFWLTIEDLSGVKVIVRQYGLLQPTNWANDAFEHLYLQNQLWNRLVEIQQDSRDRYRAIVGSDEDVAPIQEAIDTLKVRIVDMSKQRNQLKVEHRKKSGIHTEPLDNEIKAAKAEIKELFGKSKKTLEHAKDRIRTAGSAFKNIEDERRQSVKEAYNNSGLWWGNYNAVVGSYNIARNRIMREGAELRFHRFDGTGRFTCQIMGGMSIEDLVSGRHRVAQLQKVSSGYFTEIINSNQPAKPLQEAGSRRNEREYGILSITIYTAEDENEYPKRN